jgi:peroxiredoxin Q/BCP
MTRRSGFLVPAVALAALLSAPVAAQNPAPAEEGPKVGEVAPDFAFTGITRYGKLEGVKRLSDFRGQTVVLAFFPRARSRG